MDHEAIDELHGLCTLGTEFARHNDFTTLGTALHHKAEHTIASTDQLCEQEHLREDRKTEPNQTKQGKKKNIYVDERTGGQQDHREACSGETRTEQWRRDHARRSSQRRATFVARESNR